MKKRQLVLTTLVICTVTLNCFAGISAKKVLSETGVKGGLAVCINCEDPAFLAGLAGNESYLVHGLYRDAAVVQEIREYLVKKGLYGQATIEHSAVRRLPYNDNVVNLLAAEHLGDTSMDEVMRVLCPGGVAYVKSAEGWNKTIKPRPDEIDEWTHFLRDSSNNAVARDTKIASPTHLQWQAEPGRTRDHDAQASVSAMTSSNGRIFYVVDEGLTSLIHHPEAWKLVARDAFNGKLLWKRDIDSWITPLRYFRSGPVQLPRRLVSIGDKVYATLGFDAPVSVLDAATGKTIRSFKGSKKTEELICHNGVMLAVLGEPEVWNKHAPVVDNYWEFYDEEGPTPEKRIVAYDMDSGKELWTVKGDNLRRLAPLSLTAGGDKAFYLDNENLYCVELGTGKECWEAEFRTKGLFLRNYAPTVVSYKDTIACLSLERLAVFSTKDGGKLWENKGYAGFGSPGDLFIIEDTVWTFPGTQAIRVKPADVPGGGKEFLAFHLYTGEVKKSISKREVWPTGHHHRCYRNKATERFLISSRRGLEFVDLERSDNTINWWVRSICQYGFMPCNGLIYAAPHPCHCFVDYKFDGFHALAAEKSPMQAEGERRLKEGPAYGKVELKVSQAAASGSVGDGEAVWSPPILNGNSEDWPMYRHDITRSGSASTKVPVDLKKKWRAKIGGRLSSVVVARGKLLVAAIDRQMLYCLDSESGKELWNFTAAGRIDSPPTICGNIAIFGSASGHVYALRLSDGELVWRFRAAADNRRTVVRDRLESLWPVHGSVLVVNGTVYFAAGRTSYLDGGIRMFALDAESGRIRHQATMSSEAAAQTGVLSDVLVSDGRTIAMRNRMYDMSLQSGPKPAQAILKAPNGLLDDSWEHRHRWNWTLGASDTFGKLLVFDADSAYGVQAYYTFLKHDQSMHPGTHTGHLHQKYTRYTPEQFPIGTRLFARENIEQKGPAGKRGPKPRLNSNEHKWNRKMPLQFRALVLAEDVLLGAGWKDSVKAFEKNPKGKSESVLEIISTEDGGTLKEYRLKSEPVFDGMAAARGKVYLAQKDGTVLCLGGEE